MSEGQFALCEGCLYPLGVVIIVLYSFIVQDFEPSIVYICTFLVEITLLQN